MKKIIALTLLVGSLAWSTDSALAARNPAGTGQPGAECGDEGAEMEPPGFLTEGFANAEAHYAGSEDTPSALHANSEHAVSQYDVACFQLSSR